MGWCTSHAPFDTIVWCYRERKTSGYLTKSLVLAMRKSGDTESKGTCYWVNGADESDRWKDTDVTCWKFLDFPEMPEKIFDKWVDVEKS